MISIDIQRDTSLETPDDGTIKGTLERVLAALPGDETTAELSIRIVDRDEMQALNLRYRRRDYATNVLSFPADLPEELALPLLGDMAICAPVVLEEAQRQGKELAAHWDHMLVHGALHLLGYDHETDHEALAMESLEIRILADLGWPDPYATAATAEAFS